MKHLVTGGSGFLGNLIARRLRAAGESVAVLDIWEDPTRPSDIEFVNCDIRDRQGVARAMRGVDVVHHNVALVPLTKAGAKFWEVNVDGTRIAAEEAVNARVRSFVHMSSSAIFGAPERCPITAESPLGPIEIYGRGKLAGEQAARSICERAGLPLVIIRPRTILGEGRLGIFQILFEWIREHRNVYVIGSGDILFQFVHAHDLMDAYMMVLESGSSGTFNVGSDRFGTLRGDLTALIEHTRSRSKVRSLPERASIAALKAADMLGISPLAPWHYLTYHKAFHFDVGPLVVRGWKPKYSNVEMFVESFDWFCRHYDKVRAEDAGSAHRRPVKQGLLWLLRHVS
jgi:nucleoside-diphosphate-sugar epimerase